MDINRITVQISCVDISCPRTASSKNNKSGRLYRKLYSGNLTLYVGITLPVPMLDPVWGRHSPTSFPRGAKPQNCEFWHRDRNLLFVSPVRSMYGKARTLFIFSIYWSKRNLNSAAISCCFTYSSCSFPSMSRLCYFRIIIFHSFPQHIVYSFSPVSLSTPSDRIENPTLQ